MSRRDTYVTACCANDRQMMSIYVYLVTAMRIPESIIFKALYLTYPLFSCLDSFELGNTRTSFLETVVRLASQFFLK